MFLYCYFIVPNENVSVKVDIIVILGNVIFVGVLFAVSIIGVWGTSTWIGAKTDILYVLEIAMMDSASCLLLLL